MDKLFARITLAALLILSAAVCWAASVVVALDRSVGKLATISSLHPHSVERKMQTLTETVQTDSGRTVTVTTTRQDNETPEQFAARHLAVVNAVKQT